MLTAKENNRAISDLHRKVLELMIGNGVIAPCLASSSINLYRPENKNQFKLLKDPNSNQMKDFSINTSTPVTLYITI